MFDFDFQKNNEMYFHLHVLFNIYKSTQQYILALFIAKVKVGILYKCQIQSHKTKQLLTSISIPASVNITFSG